VLAMPDEPPADVTQIKQTPVKAVKPSGVEIEITEIVATFAPERNSTCWKSGCSPHSPFSDDC